MKAIILTWLSLSLMPVPSQGWTYNSEACNRPDLAAYYLPDSRSLCQSEAREASGIGRPTFFHELGHDFDNTVMTDAYRSGFIKIMRYRTSSWWACRDPGLGCQSAGERFGDAYSLCSRRAKVSADIARFKSGAGYGYYPTPSQHRRVCALIRRAATGPRQISKDSSRPLP